MLYHTEALVLYMCMPWHHAMPGRNARNTMAQIEATINYGLQYFYYANKMFHSYRNTIVELQKIRLPIFLSTFLSR